MGDIKIHPECQAMLDVYGKPEAGQSLEKMRASTDEQEMKLTGFERAFDGERTEIHVNNGDYEIPCYVYKPSKMAENPAIVVFFHGGGLLLGNRITSDSTCKEIASSSGSIVVNVEYRLAPEVKFPVQIDDSMLATKWALENKVKLGGSASSKVGVAGDSAGGYLAAAVTHELKLDFQVLVYPMVTTFGDYSSLSASRYKDGPLVTLEGLKSVDEVYLPEDVDMKHPRLNPMCRANFKGVPPALIILAEHDILVDCGKDYAEKLKGSGIPVELCVLEGAAHAFFGSFATCPTLCAEAFGKVKSFIEKINSA